MFCKVTQQTIIIIINNENYRDPITVAHIAHYTQNLISYNDSSFISLGLCTTSMLCSVYLSVK